MKTLKIYCLCLIGMLCSITTWAYDFQVNGIYYNILSPENGEVEVTKGDALYSGSVVIPETVDYNGQTYKVSTIGAQGFLDCTNLTEINLGKVQTIEAEAFKNCSKLTTIDFREVQFIKSWAFLNCSNLSSIDLKNVISLDYGAFNRCEALTSINFGKVESIGDYAFWHCISLASIDFGNVKIIGENAFQGCTSLTSVDFKNVEEIGVRAFDGLQNLTSLKFPKVKTIKLAAFGFNTGLTTLDLRSVESIGEWAFGNCHQLTTVRFGEIKSIEGLAFMSSNKITSIRIDQENPIAIVPQVFDEATYQNATLQVPMGKKAAYQSAEVWKNFANIVETQPIYLTLQQADNGNIQMLCKEDQSYQVNITATEGWHVNAVTFNGQDVTKDVQADSTYVTPALTASAILNVTYESDEESSIQENTASQITVRGINDILIIEGTQPDQTIHVYNTNGSLIATETSKGEAIQIKVIQNQVYIVKVGQRTFKLRM